MSPSRTEAQWQRRRLQPMRGGLLLAVAGALAAAPALGVDAILITAAEVRIGSATFTDVQARLDLLGSAGTAASVGVGRLRASPTVPAFEGIELRCRNPIVHEPRFACQSASLRAARSALGPLAFQASAEYRSDRQRWSADVRGLALAEGQARGSLAIDPRGWSARIALDQASLAALRQLAGATLPLPVSYALSGRASIDATFAGRGSLAGSATTAGSATLAAGAGLERLGARARVSALDLSNPEGTVVAEKLALELGLALQPAAGGEALQLTASGSSGQALAGPVLLDLGANPLRLSARARLTGRELAVEALELHLAKLLDAEASGVLGFDAGPLIRSARLDVAALEFPAAYSSFLQIPLAATDFSALETRGRASGAAEIQADLPVRITARSDGLDLRDTRADRLRMNGLAGELNWALDRNTAVAPSALAWQSAGAYGLRGGSARLEFRARARDLELLKPARIPIFDGALAVRTFGLRELGKPSAELTFEADLEPISMPLLSRAFGWPELSGTVAGRIPALSYRDRTLTFGGDLEARVFDGTIRGSGIRLQDPFGPWPRLYADVEARNLDLALVTGTFAVGSITGRLDGDIHNLELFRWSPVAFDARLATPAADPGPHRISAKAIGTLSNIGGGGGGVVASLQSGMLQFFHEFRYDRLGIECRLRNEVCLMSGIERAGGGYYIMKGSGIPRVDIIGNAGRVNWPQLVSQVVAGMRSEAITVK